MPDSTPRLCDAPEDCRIGDWVTTEAFPEIPDGTHFVTWPVPGVFTELLTAGQPETPERELRFHPEEIEDEGGQRRGIWRRIS